MSRAYCTFLGCAPAQAGALRNTNNTESQFFMKRIAKVERGQVQHLVYGSARGTSKFLCRRRYVPVVRPLLVGERLASPLARRRSGSLRRGQNEAGRFVYAKTSPPPTGR